MDNVTYPDLTPDLIELIHDYVHVEDDELSKPGLPQRLPIV